MINYSEGNSFEEILERLLDNIDDSLDKREGSIIYDALAPVAAELAQCYIALDVYTDQTYLLTAAAENLDNKAAEIGLIRNPATYSKRIVEFRNVDDELMDVDIGSRFSVPNEYGGYNYKVITRQSVGNYIAQCETVGTAGNKYTGNLLPLESINNLGTITLGAIYIAGEDIETDNSLRQRAINKLKETPFAGNVADYQQFVTDIDGIGACLVVPIWNGPGTVKLAIITSSYEIPTSAKIEEVQELVDPIQNQGQGIGQAPIGHTVTVVAPTPYELTISANISVEPGKSLQSVEEDIITSITKYIQQLQSQWSTANEIVIYISRIVAAIVSVDGVTNAENVTINGYDDNIIIDVTSSDIPYPVIKEVILNES